MKKNKKGYPILKVTLSQLGSYSVYEQIWEQHEQPSVNWRNSEELEVREM